MWNGVYERWNPIPALEGTRLYCDAVHHDWEGFRLWLACEDPSVAPVIVRWEFPRLYLSSNESYRIGEIEPPQELRFPHAFWIVRESELVERFHRASCNIHRDCNIKHFAFLTCSDCVDVLDDDEPAFDWRKSDLP